MQFKDVFEQRILVTYLLFGTKSYLKLDENSLGSGKTKSEIFVKSFRSQ